MQYSKVPQQENRQEQQKNQQNNFLWYPFEIYIWPIINIAFWTYMIIYSIQMNQKLFESHQINGLSPSQWTNSFFDNTDVMWRMFREYLPIFASLIALNAITTKVAVKYYKWSKLDHDTIFGLLVSFYLFRGQIIPFMISIGFNYFITVNFYQNRKFPYIIWAIQILYLCIIRIYEGNGPESYFKFLEPYFGQPEYPLHSQFNLTIMKMISFSIDMHQSANHSYLNNEPENDPNNRSLNYLQKKSQPLSNFTFQEYIAYVCYAPTFITGPMITYNSWRPQIEKAQSNYSNYQIFLYALNVIGNIIFMEILTHVIYVVAIFNQNTHLFENISVFQMVALQYIILWHLYGKFLVIWRIPRLWALIDGVEVPEDLKRCINMNYSIEEFWRNWHSSLNIWYARYIYVPLGGSKTKGFNIWVIFTFAALWHEFNYVLLLWGYGQCLGMFPEIFCKYYFSQKQFKSLWQKQWWKYVCAIGGALTGQALVVFNGLGMGGISGFLFQVQKYTFYDWIQFQFWCFCAYYPTVLCIWSINEHKKNSKTKSININQYIN